MKMTCLRAKWLKIATSFYDLSKGSRAISGSEKNPRSRIRGAESGSQVIGRDVSLSFCPYYLWEFWKFSLSFFSFVVSLLCNPNKIL